MAHAIVGAIDDRSGPIGHSASVVQDNRRRPCNPYCIGKKRRATRPADGQERRIKLSPAREVTSNGGKDPTGHKVRFIGIARIIAGRFVGIGRKGRHEANAGFNHLTAGVGGFNVWIAGCH